MNERISSFATPFLKYGYILCTGILIQMALTESSYEMTLFIIGFGLLIVVVNFAFYHNLSVVFRIDGGLVFKNGGKDYKYPYSEIEEIRIERLVNCQPIKVKTKDGRIFRFVSTGPLFRANQKIVEEIRLNSNKSLVGTSLRAVPTARR